MRKFIAVGLAFSMLAFSLLSVGCKNDASQTGGLPNGGLPNGASQAESLKGTNGAKLLLANENLDETIFTDTDFWEKMNGSQATENAPKMVNTAAVNTTVNTAAVKSLAYKGAGEIKSASVKPMSMTEVGEYTHWTDFENYSHTMTDFDSIMGVVEDAALDVAGNIGWLKKNVGVTDRWVNGERLLQVKEGEERLYIKHNHEFWNGFEVAIRTTRADAKNVYQIYRYSDDFGLNPITETRTVFIPNEYYEYTIWEQKGVLNSWIVENKDGFWNMTRVYANFIRDDQMGRDVYLSLEHYTLKDGYGLGFDYIVTYDGEQLLEDRINTYNFFDAENENELYRVYCIPSANPGAYPGAYVFETFMGNVEKGIDSLRAPTSEITIIPNEGKYEEWFVDLTDVVLENGTVIEEGGIVRQLEGDDYFGWVSEIIEAYNFGAALEQLESVWAERGVQFKVGAAELGELAAYTEMVGAEFKDTYTWNGFKSAQTLGDLKESVAWLQSYNNQNTELYNAVKDNAEAEMSIIDLSNTHFAELTLVGNGSYADGKVSVTDLTATVAENALLEKDEEYVVKLGLALKEETGFDSTRTVVLSTETEEKVTYGGTGELTLTQSGEYVLPTNLSEGEYAVVAYVATADEGVRVSDMRAVGFATVADERLDAVEMDIALEKAETDALLVQYAVKNTLEVVLETGKAYDETEIEKVLLDAVLMSGYPILSEKIEATEDGYRLKCLLPVSGRLVEAYVYCVLPKDE